MPWHCDKCDEFVPHMSLNGKQQLLCGGCKDGSGDGSWDNPKVSGVSFVLLVIMVMAAFL